MSKKYELKVYTFGDLIKPKKIFTFTSGNQEALKLKTDLVFTGDKNNGQGPLRLEFNVPFNDITIEESDIIRIRVYDDENKTGVSYYSGFVEEVERTINSDGQSVQVTMFGLATLMNTIIAGGGIASFTNVDPSVIITSLLNGFNAQFPSPIITFDPIPLFGSLITFRTDNTTVLSTLQQLHDITGWVFYVDGAGKFSTQPRGTDPDHKFTLKKNLDVIKRKSSRSDIVTRLYVQVQNAVSQFEFDGSGNIVPVTNYFPITFTYNNLPAQTIHGTIERVEVRNDLLAVEGVATSAVDQFSQTYLDDHSSPKNFLRLEVNDKIDFNSVKPGDLISIKNVDLPIEDAVIEKINVSSSKIFIDCEKTLDFGQEVVNS